LSPFLFLGVCFCSFSCKREAFFTHSIAQAALCSLAAPRSGREREAKNKKKWSKFFFIPAEKVEIRGKAAHVAAAANQQVNSYISQL
jgi:hypothetical protein